MRRRLDGGSQVAEAPAWPAPERRLDGYEILSLDELERYPSETHGGSVLLPLRQRLGLRAFGANCWTAEAGAQIVPRHFEESGDEELYVVVRGRASFAVGEDTLDAPAGTLVHVLPGTMRQATAEEPGTIVLAVGAPAGRAFEGRGWDEVVVAFAHGRAGDVERGRALMHDVAARQPDGWEAPYNLACFEARFGDADTAFEHLRRAVASAPAEVRGYAREDRDLASLRDDPHWQELFE